MLTSLAAQTPRIHNSRDRCSSDPKRIPRDELRTCNSCRLYLPPWICCRADGACTAVRALRSTLGIQHLQHLLCHLHRCLCSLDKHQHANRIPVLVWMRRIMSSESWWRHNRRFDPTGQKRRCISHIRSRTRTRPCTWTRNGWIPRPGKGMALATLAARNCRMSHTS